MTGYCAGTTFTANYPFQGTYSPRDTIGPFDAMYSGRWYDDPSMDVCYDRGVRVFEYAACRDPYIPYFTNGGESYNCYRSFGQ